MTEAVPTAAAIKKNAFLKSMKQTPLQRFKDRQHKIRNAVFHNASTKKLGKMNPFKGIQTRQPKYVQDRVDEACYLYALPRADTNKQLKKIYNRCGDYVTKLRQDEPKRLQDVSQYIIDGMTDVKEKFLPTAAENKMAFKAYRAHRAIKNKASRKTKSKAKSKSNKSSGKQKKAKSTKKKAESLFVPSAALAALKAAEAKTRSFAPGAQGKEKAKAKAAEDMARALWKESLKPKRTPLKKGALRPNTASLQLARNQWLQRKQAENSKT